MKLSKKQKDCFGGREESFKGYCPDCYKIYFGCSRKRADGKYICNGCKEYYEKNKFYADKKKKFGIAGKCKKCSHKRVGVYMKENPNKRKQYNLKCRDEILKSKRNRSELERETLDDNYIRRLLARYSDLAESEFTQEEIEAKRKWILKYREMGGFDWWKSEMKVRKTLERIFPGFKFPVRRPAWNLNPLTGNRIELDCYNKELRIAVEYNGKQHYEAIEDFQTEENLKAQQKRDIAKQLNCAAKGVRLIVVPYWIDDYENFLRDSLKSKK